MGNLLVGFNEKETAVDVLRRLCEKSYNSESLLYNKIDNNIFSFPKDCDTFCQKMVEDSLFFIDFQKAMKKIVYGNREYIKYFYDSRVINQIAAESSEKSSDLISESLQDVLGSGYIKGQQVRFDSVKEMNEKIDKLTQDIVNQILSNQDNLFQKEIQDYEKILFQAIKKQIYQTDFSFGYSSKDMLQKEWIINEKEFMSNITPNNKTNSKALKAAKVFEPYEKNGEVVLKSVMVLAQLGDLKNLVKGKKGTTIQIYGDKNILLPMLVKALDDFSEQTGIGIKRDSGDGTLRKENLFKIKTDGDDLSINLSFYKDFNNKNASEKDWDKVKQDIEKVIDIFFNVLLEVIIPIMQKDNIDIQTIKTFEEDCGNNSKVKDRMEKMLLDNPNSIYEIFSKRTRAHVSGMLGETLFSIFLETFNENNNTNVEIFGQTDLGTGQAAVDVGLITDSLHKIGFQIKNYGSISNTISLYSQSNKLSAEKEMQRYIETDYYKILHRIFLENSDESLLWTNNQDETDKLLNQSENILNKHIPYYIRFDEAQIENSMIQNNFYIINFSFIPASVIFYIMSETIKENIENQNYKNMFFLSSEKQENSNLLNATNFKDSWLNTYKEISNNIAPDTTENLLKELSNKLYVNFIGMRITFKNKLEILFSNASKIK